MTMAQETQKINKIIIDIGGKEYEFDGGSGGLTPGVPIPADTVDTAAIIDGAVETQDLNQDVINRMTHSYDAEGEGIRIGGFVQEASTAPTVPTQPMDVEEEEEP